MLIKCQRLMDGPGPSEAIVGIRTMQGRLEEVIVDTSLLEGAYLNVGPAVTVQENRVLIELPRESASGSSRVWVLDSELVRGAELVH